MAASRKRILLGAGALLAVAGLVLGYVAVTASKGEDPDLATAAPDLPMASAASPTPAAPVVTTPAGSPTTATSTVGTSSPAEAPAQAAATPVPPVPTSTPLVSAPKTDRFNLDSSQSSAKFVLQKTVLGTTSSAVATGAGIAGQFYVLPTGFDTGQRSFFQFDVRTLSSSDLLVNRFISSAFDTKNYPTAEFAVSSSSAFSAGYGTGSQFSFTLSGTLSLNGVSRPVILQVLAKQSGDFFSATADTDLKMSLFNVTVPNLPIGSASDDVHVQILLVANR